jgi:WhiB family transcriptional regulator, redox-sensing transcriptional regulator
VSTTFSVTDLLPDSSWQQDAACRDAEPDLFFSTAESDREEAMQLCASCPVRLECLEHALASRESYGIWGGTDEQERKRLLRRRRRAA